MSQPYQRRNQESRSTSQPRAVGFPKLSCVPFHEFVTSSWSVANKRNCSKKQFSAFSSSEENNELLLYRCLVWFQLIASSFATAPSASECVSFFFLKSCLIISRRRLDNWIYILFFNSWGPFMAVSRKACF